MAIDTAEKRRSISGVPYFIPGVTPNSAKDQEWRQESGWSYSGILAAGIAVLDLEGLEYSVLINRLHFDSPDNLQQFSSPINRLHWTVREED